MVMGYLLPMPSLENWKFHNETSEEIPQVLWYCGLEMVIQCPVKTLYGTKIFSFTIIAFVTYFNAF